MITDLENLPPYLREIRALLEEDGRVAQAFVYGSCARSIPRWESDLDLAIDCKRPLSPDECLELRGEIARISGRPVDLVDLSTCHGVLLREILTTGVRLLVPDPERLFVLLKRMVYEAEDFQPLVRRARKERVRAFAYGK